MILESEPPPPTLDRFIARFGRSMQCPDCPEEWARSWLMSALEHRDGLGAIAALRDVGWSPERIARDPAGIEDPWRRVLVESVHKMVASDLDLAYPRPPDEDIEWLVPGCDYVDPESFFQVRCAVLTLARMCSGDRAIKMVKALRC